MVPPEIAAFFAGQPQVDAWEPAFMLLTVEETGHPHVCLLSRAELEADTGHLYAVVASRTATANLARSPVATLVAVDGDTAFYLKVEVTRASESMPRALAFALTGVRRDSLGIPLTPLRYLVTGELPVIEHWAETRELLNRFMGGS
jgi:hypothetical protein